MLNGINHASHMPVTIYKHNDNKTTQLLLNYIHHDFSVMICKS